MIRGIRGATTVTENEGKEMLKATKVLVETIVKNNHVSPEQISYIWMTASPDLDATFPAGALRMIDGFNRVPVMCAQEIPVDGSLNKCIRVMVIVETERSQKEITHVYLNEARILRPDLVEERF
ncbi:chorismate mutase [Alteribacter populi]|uniref:chorismate mutase n=1 Tax=Alteribacter populi TaxID=2011011 RepID=UPI000BBA986B|nr:chorismate mutase [Alteribacter populi]